MTEDLSPVYAYNARPSMIDFSGHMAGVFFTTGCNFRCGFCHNAQHLGVHQAGMSWSRLDAACRHFKDSWVSGIVITGGEPTLDAQLPELIAFVKKHGLAVKLDTNGSHPEVLAQLLPELDYVAMDVKCALTRYPEFVAFADTASIAQSIALLKQAATACEFRTTVIEGLHTLDEFDAIGATLVGSRHPYYLQPFVPHNHLPDEKLRNHPRTPPSFLKTLQTRIQGPELRVELRGV